MSQLQPKDHVEVGTQRLSDNLSKEIIKEFLSVYLAEVFEIEEELVNLANQKSIELAEGVWLDYIGKIVNVRRNGLNDEDYRQELFFKIAVNNADGTPTIIIDLVKTFTESTDVEIFESGTAFFTLYFNGQTNTGKEVYALLEKIRPAAVNTVIHSDVFNNAFRLAYEQRLEGLENLQITLDGTVFENLLITLDGVNFEPLFISLGGDSQYEATSLKEGYNNWYYEQPSPLLITRDGVNYEELILTPSPSNNWATDVLHVIVPYVDGYVPENEIPLTWEVWSESVRALP